MKKIEKSESWFLTFPRTWYFEDRFWKWISENEMLNIISYNFFIFYLNENKEKSKNDTKYFLIFHEGSRWNSQKSKVIISRLSTLDRCNCNNWIDRQLAEYVTKRRADFSAFQSSTLLILFWAEPSLFGGDERYQ